MIKGGITVLFKHTIHTLNRLAVCYCSLQIVPMPKVGPLLPGINDCDNENCLCANEVEIDYKVLTRFDCYISVFEHFNWSSSYQNTMWSIPSLEIFKFYYHVQYMLTSLKTGVL